MLCSLEIGGLVRGQAKASGWPPCSRNWASASKLGALALPLGSLEHESQGALTYILKKMGTVGLLTLAGVFPVTHLAESQTLLRPALGSRGFHSCSQL